MTLGFSIHSDITDQELDKLSDLIKESYNELIEEFCDPLIRRINDLVFSDLEAETQGHGIIVTD
jgi:hypothetical protein